MSTLGTVADRYELHSKIGSGGMATVYRADDRTLGRTVAVKLLRADLNADETARARFAEEARASARIVHPNVVVLFDTGEDDEDQAYLVMECLSGRTLRDEIDEGPLAPERTVEVATQLLEALAAAHEVDVLHRDIKPANLLIADDGSVKVADFGIAKTATALDLTEVGDLIGSPAYLAPERLHGVPATRRSDLYSAGVVIHETITGSRLFEADTPAAIVHAITTDEIPPLADLDVPVDPGLRSAVDAALQRDPADRPEGASEMLDMIRGTALTRSIPVARPAPGPVGQATGPDKTDVLPVVDRPDVASPAEQRPDVEGPDVEGPDDNAEAPGPGVGRHEPRRLDRRLVALAVMVVVGLAIVMIALMSDGGSVAKSVEPGQTQLSPEAAEAFERLEVAVTP